MNQLPKRVNSGGFISVNQKVDQDWKGIALSSDPGGSATLGQCHVTNGTLFWGHGGESIHLTNCWTEGKAWKYRICNFDHPLKLLQVDNSGIKNWIEQGPYEAAIRLMQITEAHMIGLHVRGSKDDKGDWIKQVIQDRSGGIHYWNNCTVEGPVDIGWMTDPNIPVQPLELSHWENCTLTHWPSIRDGVKRVEYVNCQIAGFHVNKTIKRA